MSAKYLVTGASGQLGALAIDALLARVPASEVAGLVRRPEAAAPLEAKGVDVRVASYTDPEALKAAFAGIERLLLVSSSEVGQRAAQHQNVIDAAGAAGVGFVAYTSILNAKGSPLTILPGEHVATEDALAASGLDYALLRNGWYTENYTMGAKDAVKGGGLIGTIGEGRVSSAARADYAEAAAIVLTGDLPTSGTVYELAGDDSYSLPEFAAALSELSGKTLGFTDMTPEAYKDALTGFGLPEAVAAMLADSEAGAAKGGLYSDDKTLSDLLGRPTTPWRETLKAAL
ncbi:NAD(P)H-binding protein [Tropicibacter naphthalenivorans]|uniref:Quinone oxidoreductase 2 n=1 Tax=Tropicibacter naphthalenivorans TaxID=441103 RepID=A0A0P1GNV5_9RHOB|nr:NAD(P)H-binding protein [Tropicibacter naphthalenivorans]CUH77380.1 Quinone oxidoreductase 2 [Tropicibacter naphthalenivorans]SMC58460.1 NAD(P)H dehydrogenase (quinone) [Tropicibacter naphthalenivorans]